MRRNGIDGASGVPPVPGVAAAGRTFRFYPVPENPTVSRTPGRLPMLHPQWAFARLHSHRHAQMQTRLSKRRRLTPSGGRRTTWVGPSRYREFTLPSCHDKPRSDLDLPEVANVEEPVRLPTEMPWQSFKERRVLLEACEGRLCAGSVKRRPQHHVKALVPPHAPCSYEHECRHCAIPPSV